MTFFVDASFLIALFHKKDEFHKKARTIITKIEKEPSRVLTSNIVIAEAVNFVFRLKGPKEAKQFFNFLKRTGAEEVFITEEVFNKAYFFLFNQKSKKGLNFFDCLHLATMKSLGINTILTFDEEFKKWVKVIDTEF